MPLYGQPETDPRKRKQIYEQQAPPKSEVLEKTALLQRMQTRIRNAFKLDRGIKK